MFFESAIYIRIGILAYVGIWAYFKYHTYRLKFRKPSPNVFEIEKWHEYTSIAKNYGWIIGLFVIAICALLFPTAMVVDQNTHGRGRYQVKRGVVPFYYKGHFCAPGGKYLINETNQYFVLYSTPFYNGSFKDTPFKNKSITVTPHSFREWTNGIDNVFTHPTEYNPYIPDQHKGKTVIEWTIDTQEGALQGMKYVEDQIAATNELFKNFIYEHFIHKIQVFLVRIVVPPHP